MNYSCFKCDETFVSSKEAISHLKRTHFLIDNFEPIKCIVKRCDKTFNTFRGLSSHLNSFDHRTSPNVCLSFDVPNIVISI